MPINNSLIISDGPARSGTMLNNTILIIDDEEIIADAISESLEGEGYDILSARNGKEGLDLYHEKKPVLIILDLRMPVMDGIRFLEEIKLSPAELSSVIVLTGHGDEGDMKKCFHLGATAFLRKPFNLYELRGIVKNSIALKRTQRDLVEEIAERKKIAEELRIHRDNLEKLVEKRTVELVKINEELLKEIEKRKLFEEKLTNLARIDNLTGAYNRIKFAELIEQEVERFKRYGTPLSLTMFDLDHFKNINDTFGHVVGDYILKKIADIVGGNKRKLDFLIRWGGEEFMLVNSETTLDQAAILAERIRKAIEEYAFETTGKIITVSLGVTQYKEGDTPDTVIQRVDDALYRAKKNGRNRIEVNG